LNGRRIEKAGLILIGVKAVVQACDLFGVEAAHW
jgi:hypothetical protein